jgi:hypothetical protein
MKTILLAIVLVSSGMIPAQAQSAAAHFWCDKHFWIGEAIIAAGIAADEYSTHKALSICQGCQETSFLLPARPSGGALIAAGFELLAGESAMNIVTHRLMANDPNKYWRFAGLYAWPLTAATLHTALGTIPNARVIAACRQANLVCR